MRFSIGGAMPGARAAAVVSIASFAIAGCELISGLGDLEVVEDASTTASGGQSTGGQSTGGHSAGGAGASASGGDGAGGACTEPGAIGEPCCDGACEPDAACSAGTCVACGALGAPCCSADACDGGLTCTAGTCGGCVAQIEPAGVSSCARLTDGTVQCFGSNLDSELGNGFEQGGPNPVPTPVSSLTGATQVIGDHAGFCAIGAGGQLLCWGDNGYGEAGVGSDIDTITVPTPVAVLTPPVTAVGRGYSHSCAYAGASYCWGNDFRGALGDGTPADADQNAPVATVPFGPVASWALGNSFSCARTTSSDLYCWGKNDTGILALGDDDSFDHPVPTKISVLDGIVSKASATGDSICIVTTTGTVYCWGDNGFDQLGNPALSFEATTPVLVPGFTGISDITGGGYHYCALHDGGTVSCWGRNYEGQIGAGDISYSYPVPTPVQGLPTDIVEVANGYAHSCARTSTGMAYCWGRNDFGQLGSGIASEAEPLPQQVAITCP
jgi:alpha-tubulin suppressor-like RCC1 family protein